MFGTEHLDHAKKWLKAGPPRTIMIQPTSGGYELQLIESASLVSKGQGSDVLPALQDALQKAGIEK